MDGLTGQVDELIDEYFSEYGLTLQGRRTWKDIHRYIDGQIDGYKDIFADRQIDDIYTNIKITHRPIYRYRRYTNIQINRLIYTNYRQTDIKTNILKTDIKTKICR